MKTNVLLVVILSFAIFTSCQKDEMYVDPSGNVTTASIPVSGITSLDISSLFNVYVNLSETEESVVVEANENLHHLIQSEQHGETLEVKVKNNSRISGDPILNLYVTVPTLKKIKGEGAVNIELENSLFADQLELEFIGASKLSGNVEVENLFADIEGASKLELSGAADNFEINGEGASAMTGFDFETNALDADLNGGCEVSLTVHQRLDVDARGASKVYYKGNGVVENQNLKDASEIVRLN